jgi:hypothetical protein
MFWVLIAAVSNPLFNPYASSLLVLSGWLPRDRLKPIPLPMESRSNNTMPTMGDSLITYSSITVRNRVRRYPYVESVRTSKMALLKEG